MSARSGQTSLNTSVMSLYLKLNKEKNHGINKLNTVKVNWGFKVDN